MCVVSNIMDDWNKRYPDWTEPYRVWPQYEPPQVSRKEFEEMRKELEALKKLIKAAKIYDEETGQPNCEMADKVQIVKKIAEYLEVDLEDVFE